MKPFGKKLWIIAEGYIPAYGTGPEPEFTSHEAACLVNTGEGGRESKDDDLFFGQKSRWPLYHSCKGPKNPAFAVQRSR